VGRVVEVVEVMRVDGLFAVEWRVSGGGGGCGEVKAKGSTEGDIRM